MKNKKPIAKNIWWKIPENIIDEARCYIRLFPKIISGYFLSQKLGISERSGCNILKRERKLEEGDSVMTNQKALTYKWNRRNLCWSIDTMKIRFMRGWIYLMLILEEYSRLILGYKLCQRPLGVYAQEVLFDTIERHQIKPLLIKSDRGPEFINYGFQEFLAKNDISPLPSPCYYPRFNGRTEWGNRWMRKFTRPLERTSTTSFKEIENALRRGIYLINKVTPRRIFDGLTSLEVYNGAEDPTDLDRRTFLKDLDFYNKDPKWFLDSNNLDSTRRDIIKKLQWMSLLQIRSKKKREVFMLNNKRLYHSINFQQVARALIRKLARAHLLKTFWESLVGYNLILTYKKGGGKVNLNGGYGCGYLGGKGQPIFSAICPKRSCTLQSAKDRAYP